MFSALWFWLQIFFHHESSQKSVFCSILDFYRKVYFCLSDCILFNFMYVIHMYNFPVSNLYVAKKFNFSQLFRQVTYVPIFFLICHED